MAKCQSCQQEMLKVDSCRDTTIIYPDGLVLLSSTFHFDESSGRCHDCNITHGNFHHCMCDVERCPRCGGQLISCGCLDPIEENDLAR